MKTKQVKVLLIEDNPGDVRLIQEMLRKSPLVEIELESCGRLSKGLELLGEKKFDVVLLDLGLPDSQGLDSLTAAVQKAPDVPIVVLTGYVDEAFGIRAINEGAQDYLVKGQADRNQLVRSVRYAVERKQTEKALRESEERYRLLFESNPHPMWVYDLETLRFLAVNDAAVHHYGYSKEEFLGMTIKEIRPSEDVPALLENVTKVGEGIDRAGIWRHRKKDGTIIAVEITSHTLTFAGRPAEVVLANDVTEHKRMEESLRDSEKNYRNLVDNALVGVYRSNLEGRFLFANEAMAQIFECDSAEELLSEEILPKYRDLGDRNRLIEFLKRQGKVSNFEVSAHTRTGKIAHILLSAALEGDVISGMALDITEKKRLEEQLMQAQKMEAVGQLAGGVAHDFNNILSAVIGYAHILHMKLAPDDPLRVTVEQILESADRAATLTHSLLAFSRKQIMNPKPLDLNEIIKRVERFLFRLIGEDIELRTIFREEQLNAVVDGGQIEQVLMNLATNARDAMPHGGCLTISSELMEIDDAYVKAHGYGEPGMYAVITVSDTGIGMDEATKQKIFDPFFTTKEMNRGTGLGLAMVYGIIKQHKGYINVYSEPGRGTTFKMYLPAFTVQVKAAASGTVPAPQPSGGSETILVAEDDPALRKLSRIILNEFGYTVLLAEDGEEAIAKFRENKDAVQLVIMDMIMPKKSGKEAYEEILKIRPDIKVLFASGYTADKIHKNGVLEDGLDLILKPVSPKDLLRKVREILDRKG